MPFDTYGSPAFSLDDCKIATWLATGSYDTEVDVMAVRVLGGDPQFTEAMLDGDDYTVASNSRMRRMSVELEFGDVSLTALEVLLGVTIATDGATYERFQLGTEERAINAPYIGIAGRALEDGGDGDVQFWWPKAKVASIAGLRMEQDNYVIPRATLTAVLDGDRGIFSIIKNATAQAVTIPPANTP